MVDVDAPLRAIYLTKFLRWWKCGMGKETSVTVVSQVNLIRRVAYAEIFVGIIILFSQTVAIASSHEFATRSLTGIWTSWFFFISAGITLFWSSRCTFNGLLSILVLQIISATMGIPLFTASCLLFGVYNFRWHPFPDGSGEALVGSSISILVTNLIMMFASMMQMGLNGYNAYNCYFLAYGGKPKEDYDIEEDAGNGRTPSSIARDSKENSRNPTPSRINTSKTTTPTHTNTYNRTGAQTSNGSNRGRPNSGSSRGGGNRQPNSNSNQNNGSAKGGRANNISNQNQNNDEDWGGDNTTTEDWGNTSANQPQQEEDWRDDGNNAGNNEYGGNNEEEDWGDNSIQIQSKGQAPKGPKIGQRTLSPKKSKTRIVYADPAMPQPPPDLTLASTDIAIIKYCGVTGVVLAILIFSCQTAMLALAVEPGIKIGVGIWGALYYAATGVITVYNGWKPTAQSSVAIFILQAVQLVLSLPLVGIAYYIVAVFGSCFQFVPVAACPPTEAAGLAITVLGSVMAISGTAQGLISLILMLICSQAVCGIRCMVSGATVYPTL